MQSLKYSFFTFLAITAAAIIARVLVSFALISAAVGHTLSVTNSPFSIQQLASAIAGGFKDVTSIVGPSTRQSTTISVLDAPAELESLRKARDARVSRTISVLDAPAGLEELRKARDARLRSSGPLIIKVGQ